GVNQLQRYLPALDPGFVRMDERNSNDIINFLRELSKQIRFYDQTNRARGDWSPFFELFDTVGSIIAKAATVGPLQSVKYNNGNNGFGATLTASAIGRLP